MLPPIYSLCRAWSSEGIGESPTEPLHGAGNQYIWADAQVWDQETPGKLAPWLMFNAQQYDKCGWATATAGNWHFVAYLRGSNRETYYAHARVWHKSEWTNGEQDPGIWLGDLAAFDPPWKPPEQPSRVPPPDLRDRLRGWKDVVGREQSAAATLLACLGQAIENGGTVIWRVPSDDFRGTGTAASLAAFARAALPVELKARAKIRVNASDPSPFLRMGVHLLVLAEDDNRGLGDATVLDRRGTLLAGDPPSAAHTAYARAVVERTTAYPDALLRFSTLVRARLDDCGKPEMAPQMNASAKIVYNLAIAGIYSSHDELFLKKIAPDSRQRQGLVLNWEKVVAQNDWASLKGETLRELALMSTPTADSRLLRDAIWGQLRARDLDMDAAVAQLWRPDREHALQLLDLANRQRRLVTELLAARLLRTLPAAVVLDLLLDDGVFRHFLNLLSPAELPDAWRDAALMASDKAAKLFLHVSSIPAAWQVWRPWVDSWVATMARSSNLPEEVGPRVAQIGIPDSARAEVLVNYGDLYTRFDELRNRLPAMAKTLIGRAADEAVRNSLLEGCLSGASPFLRQHLPTEWVMRYAGGHPPDGIYSLLDERLVSRSAITEASIVINTGRWLEWRLHSKLEPAGCVKAAYSWLRAQPQSPPLEHWTQAMQDLAGRISGAAALELKHSIPWIEGFQREQMDGMIASAADLGAVAELTRLEPGGPDLAAIERKTPLMAGLPPGTLAILAGTSITGAAFTVAEASLLMQRCGHLKRQALWCYVGAWVCGLTQDPASRQDSTPEPPWNDAEFRGALASWVLNNEGTHQFLWGRLDAAVQLHSSPPPSQTNLRFLASRVAAAGHKRLAAFLAPPSAGAFYVRLAEVMASGDVNAQEWAELDSAVRVMRPANALHPLCELADALSGLDARQQQELEANGWQVFELAAKNYPCLMDLPMVYRGPMPQFILMARIKTKWSLGRIATELVRRRRSIAEVTPRWTEALRIAVYTATRSFGGRGAGDDPDIALAVLCRVYDLLALNKETLVETA